MTDQPFELNQSGALSRASVNASHNLARIDAAIWGVTFQLFIPKEWSLETNFGQRIDAPLRAVPLGLFLEPKKDGSALISVTGFRMEMEVSLEDWAHHVLAQHKVIPFGGTWVKTARGLHYEAGAAQGMAPNRTFSRIAAFAASGVIFMVTSQCSESLWPSLKDSFLLAGLSFEILGTHPGSAGTLEPCKAWTAEGNPKMSTIYPAAWLAEPVQSLSPETVAVDFKLPDSEQKQLLAYLRLKFSSGSPEKALARILKQLREAGFDIDPKRFARCEPDSYSRNFVEQKGMWIGSFTREGESGEVRIGMRQVASTLVSASLVCPAQVSQPIIWMRAKRAFELALNHASAGR